MAAKGIDLSHCQGNINLSKVKTFGIKFAIIKAGGSDDGFYTDSKWETNYRGAKKNGIAVGAYYFAGPKCVTADAGKADAKRFIKLLKGKKLEYPVYFDCEAQPASKRSGTTKAAIAFCKELEKAGYYAGIYASGMLFITLPSGRKLTYVRPRIGTNKFGGSCITYEGVGRTKK